MMRHHTQSIHPGRFPFTISLAWFVETCRKDQITNVGAALFQDSDSGVTSLMLSVSIPTGQETKFQALVGSSVVSYARAAWQCGQAMRVVRSIQTLLRGLWTLQFSPMFARCARHVSLGRRVQGIAESAEMMWMRASLMLITMAGFSSLRRQPQMKEPSEHSCCSTR